MKEFTSITVVLDRSGSMHTIATDTIGGFNKFVDDQKAAPGECELSLIQFDTQNPQEVVFDYRSIYEIPLLTDKVFSPRGGTPLYDAVGQAIIAAGKRYSNMPESVRPQHVIFAIITDGAENSSREYSRQRVFELIRVQTEVYKWNFVYLGANQDALKVGAHIGISLQVPLNYTANPLAVRAVYIALSNNTSALRAGTIKNMNWTAEQRQKAVAATPSSRP